MENLFQKMGPLVSGDRADWSSLKGEGLKARLTEMQDKAQRPTNDLNVFSSGNCGQGKSHLLSHLGGRTADDFGLFPHEGTGNSLTKVITGVTRSPKFFLEATHFEPEALYKFGTKTL